MTMTHDECRDAVAEGSPVGTAAEAHLAVCATCRAFAGAVADLDRRAAAVAPGDHPPGLPDRIVTALRLDAGHRRSTWNLIRPLGAVAAAVLLVAVAVSSLALPNGEDEPRNVLLAAATKFEEQGATEVAIDAVSDVEVTANGRDPDFSKAPPEVRDHMSEQWNHMMAEFDRRLAELDQRIDEMLSRVPGAPPSPPRDQPRPVPPGEQAGSAPARPESASLTIRIRASGAVDASAGVQLEGAVAALPGSIGVSESTTAFAIDASGRGTAALRTPDGTWVETDAGSGPLGRILLDPRAVPAILRSAEGDILAGASTTLGDDQRGLRYTFRVPGSVAGGGTTPWTASAVIDENGRVRQLALTPLVSDQQTATRTRLTVDIGGRAALDGSRSPGQLGGLASADTTSPFASVSPVVRAAVDGSTR